MRTPRLLEYTCSLIKATGKCYDGQLNDIRSIVKDLEDEVMAELFENAKRPWWRKILHLPCAPQVGSEKIVSSQEADDNGAGIGG